MHSTATWTAGMAFDASVGEHHIAMDVTAEHGGDGAAPTPKTLLLASLAGCMGISVLSILEKMRLQPHRFRVTVRAEEVDTHPKVFSRVQVLCAVQGQMPPERLLRAVHLSESRYCPISAMLAKGCPVETSVVLNGEPILALESAPLRS